MASTLTAPPTKKKIRLVCLLIGCLGFLFSTIIYLFQPQFLNDIEGRFLDQRFRLRGVEPVSDLVALVTIDEKTISALGRWPLSRTVIADIIKAINNQGAITIGLDIVFSEQERQHGIERLKKLGGIAPSTLDDIISRLEKNTPDKVLAQTQFNAGNIVNGHFFYTAKNQTEGMRPVDEKTEAMILSTSSVTALKSRSEDFPARIAYAVAANIPEIAMSGEGAGFFNFIPGNDGIIRNAPLVLKYKDEFYPSLALKALANYLDNAPIIIHAEEYGITEIMIGGHRIATNELGEIMINYRGPKKTIPTYSALDVLNGTLPDNALRDKLVLFGVTAIGVYDAHSTPFGPSFPGLEIQANVTENLIANDAIHHTSLDILIDIISMAVISLLLSLILPLFKSMYIRAIFALVLISLYAVANYYAFTIYTLWIAFAYPLLAWLLTYIALNLYFSIAVESHYSMIKSAFKSYLHPQLVDELTQRPELLQFGGEEKVLTILFSDIRNFTNMSEGLEPQQLARFLQCYMDPMTEQVLNNNGTLDKYIGDAVMAIFGAPYPSPQHPIDACRTALGMIEDLAHVHECCPDLEHIFPIKIGIGVHTGDVVVGNLGSSFRFTYTVLGDNVNLTSRLEGLSKNYGVSIIISEATHELVSHRFNCRELDRVRVKGKQIPIKIFELRGDIEQTHDADFLLDWHLALDSYQRQDWAEAATRFTALLLKNDIDKPCQLYIERCENYQKTPPPTDWDGVFTHTSK